MDADLLRRSRSRGLGQSLKGQRLKDQSSKHQSVKSASVPPVLRTRERAPRPPRQARSSARREQLLCAGRVLFAEKGFEATSIAQIAAKANTAAGAFYIYFRSKRQLLVALMNELLERLSQVSLAPSATGDIHQGLRTFLLAVFRVDLDYFGVIRAWQEASLIDAELGRMQTEIQSWTEGRILRVFELLQTHPTARADCDLPTFARMMDRHFWALLARGSHLSRKDFDREVITAADVIYHYLLSDPPGWIPGESGSEVSP